MDNKMVNVNDDHVDDHVELEIQKCFNFSEPKCFFTYAGAGSGKTRSLVNTLNYIRQLYGEEFTVHAKQVAVITYTNAACDEIISRVENSAIFFVSTIHSFLWEIVCPYQRDIKVWVKRNIKQKLEETEEAEAKGRKGTKASNDRLAKIEGYKERLKKIDLVCKFSYNPNGENVGYDSLDHADVIKMGSEFIQSKSVLQKVIISRFPVLLIDESQDTKKELVDALLQLYKENEKKIVIGMFGDTMQRIYLDGKENLADCIPEEWVKPIKIMNHRSARRIVNLANAIRAFVDDKEQRPRSDAKEGTVHLFIADSSCDKSQTEKAVAKRMAHLTMDDEWEKEQSYQCLILEHHMAARRLGFENLFLPLYRNKKLAQSALDGSLPEVRLFSQMVFPLIDAHRSENRFEVAKVIKRYSPLLSKENLENMGKNQLQGLQNANSATKLLCELFEREETLSCIDVINEIQKTGIFSLPDRVTRVLYDYEEGKDALLDSLRQALSVSVEEMRNYCLYTSGNSSFSTHQGVKGLEYPRVMVVMDDTEAEGFLFSYEKLFGAKETTDTDRENERKGADSSISRTRRLFYVACTRAKESLALVAYTQDKESVKQTVLHNKWFSETEISIV